MATLGGLPEKELYQAVLRGSLVRHRVAVAPEHADGAVSHARMADCCRGGGFVKRQLPAGVHHPNVSDMNHIAPSTPDLRTSELPTRHSQRACATTNVGRWANGRLLSRGVLSAGPCERFV
jgi:hypothetical protein